MSEQKRQFTGKKCSESDIFVFVWEDPQWILKWSFWKTSPKKRLENCKALLQSWAGGWTNHKFAGASLFFTFPKAKSHCVAKKKPSLRDIVFPFQPEVMIATAEDVQVRSSSLSWFENFYLIKHSGWTARLDAASTKPRIRGCPLLAR